MKVLPSATRTLLHPPASHSRYLHVCTPHCKNASHIVQQNPCLYCFQTVFPFWWFLCFCQKRVMVNMFLDMVADPPQCLIWLHLMHRMANVENGTQTDKQQKLGPLHLCKFDFIFTIIQFMKFNLFAINIYIFCFSTLNCLVYSMSHSTESVQKAVFGQKKTKTKKNLSKHLRTKFLNIY